MKKIRKLTTVLALMAILAGMTACSKEEAAPPAETEGKTTVTTETEKKDEPNQVTAGTGTQENNTVVSDELSQAEEDTAVSFSVYSSNDDATALIQETVEVSALSPENVLAVLVEHGALQDDIRILGLTESEDNGQKLLNIDFSQEFAAYVKSMGTAGEYMILGSVTNTFLSAYGCDRLQITVEGGVLSTGHNEYSGYYGYYE